MRSRKRKRRPDNNRSAIKESSRSNKEDICVGTGDFPNITEGGDIQGREDHQCEKIQQTEVASKSQARSPKQPDEAPNKRLKLDSTISKRAAIKRPSDNTGESDTNKKKKEEELRHDSPGEGPSVPIIELTAQRGKKRSYKSEVTSKSQKSQARSPKQPDEAPNKRLKLDSTISKRAAIKRPSDNTGESDTNKKKKEEELRHDSPGEGPSVPIIELTARRGKKRSYKSEVTSKSQKSQARSPKQPDEAPNKRLKLDSTISKRAAIKRPSDNTGESDTNKKKKEEELRHDSPGEGPSAPIIELTARRGKKRSYKSEDPDHQKKFKKGTAGVSGTPPASPPETSAAPHILERLTYHRIIGEGGFGKVLLASHPNSRERLAVKLVKKRSLLRSKNPIFIERDILQVTGNSSFFTHGYATSQTPEHVIFIMEYLSGGDLFQLIERRAPLGEATTRFLTAEILCGLQFLHSRDIIHRDIKPENVLLDAVGHAKICDFGLAVKNTSGQEMLGVAGTMGYMAPEMLSRDPYDAMVDIFSLGVTMYEMATGYQPFYCGEENIKVARSVLNDDPVYPEELSPGIINIMKRFLCKCPYRRHHLYHNIRGHHFFCPINWEDLEAGRTSPPFKMQPTPVTMLKDRTLDDLIPPETSEKPVISEEEQHRFRGFSFESHRWKTMDNQSSA